MQTIATTLNKGFDVLGRQIKKLPDIGFESILQRKKKDHIPINNEVMGNRDFSLKPNTTGTFLAELHEKIDVYISEDWVDTEKLNRLKTRIEDAIKNNGDGLTGKDIAVICKEENIHVAFGSTHWEYKSNPSGETISSWKIIPRENLELILDFLNRNN